MFRYGKDFLRKKLKTSDDLPYNKMINIPVCVLIVSSIFKENNNYYPQILKHDCFYEYENNNLLELCVLYLILYIKII